MNENYNRIPVESFVIKITGINEYIKEYRTFLHRKIRISTTPDIFMAKKYLHRKKLESILKNLSKENLGEMTIEPIYFEVIGES